MDSSVKKLVFEFSDYKDFLNHIVGGAGRRTGHRAMLSKACGCNTAYISQVLNGANHLSLEQSQRANRYLKNTKEEAHYFLLLVQKARAGNHELKSYFNEQIESIKSQRLNLKNRMQMKSMTTENQAIYYSHWYFAAIHVALAIPHLQTKSEIAVFFNLPQEKVGEVLEFLSTTGLARYETGKWLVGSVQIHLGSDSPHISKHHSNWRNQAIVSFDRSLNEDLHYSAAITLSKKALTEMRKYLVEHLRNSIEIVTKSIDPDYECYALNLDLFNLKR